MPKIAIVNRSSVMEDAAVSAITQALQTQVSRDFEPIWGARAQLSFVGSRDKAPKDAWWLLVLDSSDQADALGYHDVTPAGLPTGKAFAKSDIDDGLEPSVTISHELLEMLADPEINLCAQVGNRLYAYEVCDPCEADAYGYRIGGVLVSDFVTPVWFQPVPRPRGGYDFRNKIKRPLALLPGGYLQYLALESSDGWQQVTADKRPLARLRARPGSRRERRRVGRASWQRSTRS
jgi:hypothetical protein